MCGSLYRFLRNARLAVGDVIAHGVVEKHGVLGNDTDLCPQRGQCDIAHVPAIHQQTPGGNVEEPREQMNEGALARAAGADQRENFTGLHFQINVRKHFARAIAVTAI